MPISGAHTGLQYDPNSNGIASVDTAAGKTQLQAFYWIRKAIVESRKDQFFSPLSSTTGMPKHFGKEVRVLEYVPLLDERNINDQGIDALGVTIDSGYWKITFPASVLQILEADSAAAEAAIEASGLAVTVGDKEGAAGATYDKLTIAIGTAATIAAAKGAGEVPSVTAGGHRLFGVFSTAQKTTLLAALAGAKLNDAAGTDAIDSVICEQLSGNMYGSSKDIGTIDGKIPTLNENGGRVNRVGFTRLQRSGTISKFGFFYEFNKESLDFDSDPELNSHLSTELMNGAVQLTEAVLQKDLLSVSEAAVIYAGSATSNDEVTGEGGTPGTPGTASLVTYEDLMRLAQTLTDNRTPKQTKVISGSRMVDTKTIGSGRVMFVGSEIVPHLKGLEDLHGNPAFIPVHMYADAGNVLNGEIGTIDEFRLIQVPEMLHWSDGALHTDGGNGFRVTGDRYNVYPMLVIGDDAFTSIGFQTDGKSAKFQVITRMPGNETADRTDPYGESGFSSIKWYYGILVRRPERIGLIKTVAPL